MKLHGDIYSIFSVIFMTMILFPDDARFDSAITKSKETTNSTSEQNQIEFFKHIRWLTNRFVDYKYFCASEFGKPSPYAIQDNLPSKNSSKSLNDLKTKNIWILRNKKCMNFSNVKMNYYDASRVCSKNHFKQTRLLHRKEMSFLLRNSNSHYKGINIYDLYAKLNRKPVEQVQQGHGKADRSLDGMPIGNYNSQSRQSYREFVFMPKSKYSAELDFQDQSRKATNQKALKLYRDAKGHPKERSQMQKENLSLLAAKSKKPFSSQLYCEDPVQEFQIWLNDDNMFAGFECSTIEKAPVIKFNPRECKNGCYDCLPRNTAQAYFVCVKNCDWKVPYGSYCNTMNRSELYLYENLYFQQDELIYLCQGHLECIDYTCKCSKNQHLRREHFCE